VAQSDIAKPNSGQILPKIVAEAHYERLSPVKPGCEGDGLVEIRSGPRVPIHLVFDVSDRHRVES